MSTRFHYTVFAVCRCWRRSYKYRSAKFDHSISFSKARSCTRTNCTFAHMHTRRTAPSTELLSTPHTRTHIRKLSRVVWSSHAPNPEPTTGREVSECSCRSRCATAVLSSLVRFVSQSSGHDAPAAVVLRSPAFI